MLDDFGNGVIIPPPTGIPDGGTEETPFNDNFLIGNVDMHSYPSHFNLHLSPVGGHTAIRMDDDIGIAVTIIIVTLLPHITKHNLIL